jgi:hypothetical protein
VKKNRSGLKISGAIKIPIWKSTALTRSEFMELVWMGVAWTFLTRLVAMANREQIDLKYLRAAVIYHRFEWITVLNC